MIMKRDTTIIFYTINAVNTRLYQTITYNTFENDFK